MNIFLNIIKIQIFLTDVTTVLNVLVSSLDLL